MIQRLPVHDLLANLEAARLAAIKELAGKRGALPADTLQAIANLQTTLTAVREEIDAHEIRPGQGGEQPLK